MCLTVLFINNHKSLRYKKNALQYELRIRTLGIINFNSNLGLIGDIAFTLNNCDEFTFVRGCNAVTSPNCLDWRWYILNIECLP